MVQSFTKNERRKFYMGKLLFIMLVLILTTPVVAFSSEVETVKTDSFTMDYFRFGNGDRTLVVIPGVSVQSVMNYTGAIEESYKLLTDDFTIYVIDRRKDMPPHYPISEMADDTAKAIKALGLSKVCIFGASQGGMIAMKIAIEYPELVESMILGSTSARVTSEQYSSIFEGWIKLAREGNAKALSLSFGEAIYPQSVFEQSKELLIESAKTVTGEELNRFIIITEGLKDFDVTNDLRKIASPVLVIGSRSDRIFGGDASAQIMEKIIGCEIFMYDDYGHAAYDVAPNYRERMLKFFREH